LKHGQKVTPWGENMLFISVLNRTELLNALHTYVICRINKLMFLVL